MAFDALTGAISCVFSYNAQKNGPSSGISFPATANANTLNLKTSIVLGGNVANGANEVVATVLSIAGSGTANIDMTALTDVLGAASVTLVRLKGYAFQLLGAAEDSVNGTVCSSITIGNAGSNGNSLNLGAVANTIVLNNGEWAAWGTRQAAGKTVDGTHKVVLITNNDGSNAAAILQCLVGATS